MRGGHQCLIDFSYYKNLKTYLVKGTDGESPQLYDNVFIVRILHFGENNL